MSESMLQLIIHEKEQKTQKEEAKQNNKKIQTSVRQQVWLSPRLTGGHRVVQDGGE